LPAGPRAAGDLEALALAARAVSLEGLPPAERAPVEHGIAVGGTATSAAAIDQALDPYDPARVHGYPLLLATIELLMARMAEMTEDHRRPPLGPDPHPR